MALRDWEKSSVAKQINQALSKSSRFESDQNKGNQAKNTEIR